MTTDTAATMGWDLPAVYDAGPGWATALLDAFDQIAADVGAEHTAAGLHEAINRDLDWGTGEQRSDTIRADTAFKKGATAGYIFVLADLDADGDFDPLTSTDWDDQAYAQVEGGGTINWNTKFGVPTSAKAVAVRVRIYDTGLTPETSGAFTLCATATTVERSLDVFMGVTVPVDTYVEGCGIVPIAADGTSRYRVFTRKGDELLYIKILVIGYYI